MFGVILHPQSVARRRAVPELVVRGTQPGLAGLRHVLIERTITDGASKTVEAQSRDEPLEVVVEYRLAEYLRTLCDYFPTQLRRQAHVKGKAAPPDGQRVAWPNVAMIYCIGSLAFIYKVRRVGTCRFKVDHRGVDRSSKDGTLQSPWQEITAVLKLSETYLVLKSVGAMPIPFRCMSAQERVKFERLAGAKLSAPGGVAPNPSIEATA